MATNEMVNEAVGFVFLQEALDLLGDTPGSILIRGPDMWYALPPGPLGYVLVIGEGALPIWVDPATVPFGG